MRIDIARALRDLDQLVDRIAELVEWSRLSQQERRSPLPNSFDLNDHIDEEMLALQICFADAELNIRDVLARPDLEATEDQRRQWQQQLDHIRRRVANCLATGRFNRP
ncbi:MAG TPA: hypothetical protein PKY77_10875 [Phycisphaerae bacterium]|nr:hypothetical protein [Phycisphaerae bacterium]HRY70084.1 hypothetical protein [Phycisphaerae bacterium]HSA27360.1 hypothetical protein [Phycisphaerae bacterium]